MRGFAFGKREGVAGRWPRRSAAFEGPTGDGPSIRCSKQDVISYRREYGSIRDSKHLPVRARTPAANRYIRCFDVIRHERGHVLTPTGPARPGRTTWPSKGDFNSPSEAGK